MSRPVVLALPGKMSFSAIVCMLPLLLVQSAYSVRVNVSDAKIDQVVQQMRRLDTHAARPGDIVLNFQGAAHSHHFFDNASQPFFSHVNPQLLTTPTFAAYHEVAEHMYFDPQVNDDENHRPAKERAIDAFVDVVTNSTIFKTMFAFMRREGVTQDDFAHFRPFLRNLWFGQYSRGHGGTRGSSGFEHVFVGEWKNRKIEGQHFWLHFRTLEKRGQINYNGVIAHDGDLLATIQYSWGEHRKPIGGFFVGTSPEFDFSLVTLCAMAKRGNRGCKFHLNNYHIAVTTFLEHSHGGPYLATGYPLVLRNVQ